MNNIYKLFISASLILSIITSCSNFDDINTNPNTSDKVPAGMIATELLISTLKDPGNKYFCYHNMMSKHIAWDESADEFQYNRLNNADYSIYGTLRNCEKMLESASEIDLEAYEALALFLKAYNLFYLSLEVGDIPYTEALKATEQIYTPRYDTQKEVMIAILNDLDIANEKFSRATEFSGDPIYGGNPQLWQKCVNSFQLKVLINLSLRVDDADLKIKERFANVMKRPIISSNAENFQLVYSDKGGQLYPFNTANSRHTAHALISTVLIDPLKELKDYRVFAFAEPSISKIEAGISADSFDAYIGVDPSLPFDEITALVTDGKYCGLNKRYSDYAPGEPVIRIGYAELNFILAEAANLSIISDSPEKYYEEGVRAALEFVGQNTPDQFNHGRKITTEYINSYLDNPDVKLSSNSTEQLEQIHLQKYLTRLLHNKWDAYYDYRRTGLPELPINPESNMNQDPNTLPTRWRYPNDEYRQNAENLQTALDRQYGGNDSNNEKMWIIK